MVLVSLEEARQALTFAVKFLKVVEEQLEK